MFEVGKDIFKHGFYGGRADRSAVGRLRIIYGVFLFAFVVFGLRTLQLGIQGSDVARRGGDFREWSVKRADIIDRNGEILAKNVESGHIQLVKKFMRDEDREDIARTIHQALPYEYSLADATNLVNSSQKFIMLKKYASEKQRKIIKDARLSGCRLSLGNGWKRPAFFHGHFSGVYVTFT